MINAIKVTVLSLLAIAGTAYGDKIYKHVDEYGNVTYSDSPAAKEAETLDLRPLNTTPPVEIKQKAEKPQATPEPEKPAINYRLRIASPTDNYQVGPAEQMLSVVFMTQHKLADGHFFQLSIDGKPYGEPSTSNSVNVNVTRSLQGKRTLTAAILDASGNAIETTPATTIYVIRPPVPPKKTPR